MDVFENFFSPFKGQMREEIDVDKIRHQWQALATGYDLEQWKLPLPIWAQRPFEHDGRRAWEELRQEAYRSPQEQPLCIYLHIPFCTSKCGFCDSYSFKLGANISTHIERYVDQLCNELRLWSRQGNLASRPVSTVHMGGGTPTLLDPASFQRLVSCCHEVFSVSDRTEWALESTVEGLSPSMTACLHDLGYRRLHIGVQSLQADVRQAIGRRQSPAEVITTIEKHLASGWVVSVDLLCGLPGQTLQEWIKDIKTLISIGADGFSLYELLIYPQNRLWAGRYNLLERTHLPNYFLFQAGANLLAEHGYRKNLFNHWANKRDQNIYFTYPTRGEDLVAIGTIADGVIGDYHYRHPRYSFYLSSVQNGFPGLEGGLRENDREKRIKPAATAILSNSIPANLLQAIQSFRDNKGMILERWMKHQLIEPARQGGFQLTPNGAWLAGNMILELSGALMQSGSMGI
jgi:coproporphyrinogen III oxidase-like Fe-S oxidoreductase